MSIFSGCASTKTIKLNRDVLKNQISNNPITIIIYKEIPLDIFTPVDALLVDQADTMTRPDDQTLYVYGPSYHIGKYFRDNMLQATNMNLEEIPMSRTDRPIDGQSANFDGYTLTIQVDLNRFGYLPLAWKTYRYIMHAHGSLYDPDGKVLWQKGCVVVGGGGDKDLQLHKSEFDAEVSKRIGQIFSVAGKRCADQLSSEFN